jgi:23S rRNA (uridine2552-2'-O)-methyltransferase
MALRYAKEQNIVVNLKRESMKKKGSSQFVVQDKWFHEAKRLGYRARSAFKLLEIQEKHQLITSGMKVFDLASAPGSFLQVIAKIVGPNGIVLGVDIQKIDPLGHQNVHLLQASVFEKEAIEKFCLDQ